MNIRQAILAAADHIGRYPDEFRFSSVVVPKHGGCGTPGCALGWIGTFSGARARTKSEWGFDADTIGAVAFNDINPMRWSLLGISQKAFYDRMNNIQKGWQYDAESCAAALRLYADKYHPETVKLPDWNAIAAQRTVSESADGSVA